MVEIELPDLEPVRKQLAAFPGGADLAIAHTVTDVAKSAKAAATEYIVSRYLFPTQGPVQRSITAKGASSSREHAVVRFAGARFPLKLFQPTQVDLGVEFMEIIGTRSLLEHVFTAQMQYGPGVFERKSDARGPVQSVTGLSVANMARQETEILPAIEKHCLEQLTKRLKFWVGEVLAGKQAKYQRRGQHTE